MLFALDNACLIVYIRIGRNPMPVLPVNLAGEKQGILTGKYPQKAGFG
jgi:hypothetical protein